LSSRGETVVVGKFLAGQVSLLSLALC